MAFTFAEFWQDDAGTFLFCKFPRILRDEFCKEFSYAKYHHPLNTWEMRASAKRQEKLERWIVHQNAKFVRMVDHVQDEVKNFYRLPKYDHNLMLWLCYDIYRRSLDTCEQKEALNKLARYLNLNETSGA